MLLERIYDEDLAQASYFIGCQRENTAVVVDPRRDIEVFQRLAHEHSMQIVAVTETHIHADFLSGTRELAAATGATMYVSAEGGEDWQYRFEAERLHDGSRLQIGNITIEAVHTPGHTPEHLSFLVTDGAFADTPGYMLTGDFVFIGDLGRPDLLDEAAGGIDTRFEGAQRMFRSLKEKFLTLPDHVQVYPAHGAGSACGKALGAIPSTTVGYERNYAWWSKYVENNDEAGFVDELLFGQPDAPFYFGRMKNQNRQGPDVMGERGELPEYSASQLAPQIESGALSFVDTRPVDEVHKGTVKHALHIPSDGKIASFGAWAVDPDRNPAPLVLLAPNGDAAREIWDHLVRVGIDDVTGYIPSMDGLPQETPEVIDPAELEGFDRDFLLDVRAVSEYQGGHIDGAEQLHGGRVLWNLEKLPQEGTIVTYCQSGLRSSIVANMLRNNGFQVAELRGSINNWMNKGREVVTA